MIDSLRNINKESLNTVLFKGSTTHYPGAELIMAIPFKWKDQIYRKESVDSADVEQKDSADTIGSTTGATTTTTPTNTESLVETKVPAATTTAADGVSSDTIVLAENDDDDIDNSKRSTTMEPLEMDEGVKNQKTMKTTTTRRERREPRDIVGFLYGLYNILMNILHRRGVLPSILVILYVLSICLGLFVDGAVVGVQILSSFITIVMGMMLHRVAAPFLGKEIDFYTKFFFFCLLTVSPCTLKSYIYIYIQTCS